MNASIEHFIGPTRYNAFLIRMWQEGEQRPWRASAQSAQSGELLHFATLEALFDFLVEQTNPGPQCDNELRE